MIYCNSSRWPLSPFRLHILLYLYAFVWVYARVNTTPFHRQSTHFSTFNHFSLHSFLCSASHLLMRSANGHSMLSSCMCTTATASQRHRPHRYESANIGETLDDLTYGHSSQCSFFKSVKRLRSIYIIKSNWNADITLYPTIWDEVYLRVLWPYAWMIFELTFFLVFLARIQTNRTHAGYRS